MRRYFNTLRRFWVAAVSAEMEYRANFAIALFTSFGGVGGSLYVLWIIFYGMNPESSGTTEGVASVARTLNDWSFEQALIVMGVFTILEGVSESLMTPNLSRIVQHVRLGTLDFVLLKPIDSQFWLSTRNVSLWGIPTVMLGFLLIGVAGYRLDLPWTSYVLGIVPVALALTMLYSLWFILGATSIWFVKIYNVTEVLRAMLEAGKYPIAAFPVAFRFFFTFVVPVAFMTTVPAEMILGRANWNWMIGAAALAIGLFIASRMWWRHALKFYTSASS